MTKALSPASLREPADSSPSGPAPVGYLMSRFPKISETFVLFEMIAMERLGQPVALFPLIWERQPRMHPEARPWLDRMHYARSSSPAVIASNLAWLRRKPRAYLTALRDIGVETFGSANFFFGGLATFGKSAHYAALMEHAGVSHLHCHFASHPALAGFTVHRLTGIPFSFVAHGSDLHVERRMLARKVSEAAFVVAISEFNRDIIIDHCGAQVAEKVQVVHCGVDTDVFCPDPNRTPEQRPGTLSVVCVGTLHEVKGQRVLIDAIAECRRRGVTVQATLVGDGPDRDELARLAVASGVADQVTLTGSATRDEVVAHLRGADALVTPSVVTKDGKREGIPVVIMEAMACGLPVVASHLSGIPELVTDGIDGLLTPPGDHQALAAALGRLAAEPATRLSMGRAGRSRIEADFDLSTNAAKLLALIEAAR